VQVRSGLIFSLRMRILPGHIRIYQVRENTWSLDIVWQPTFQVTSASVRLMLDRSMIALPAQQQEYRGPSLNIGLTGITAGLPLNATGMSVSENGRIVEFKVFELFLKSAKSLRSKIAKSILFEWLDSSTLPKKIEIVIEITKRLKSKQTLTLVGYNVKESFIEFAAARSDTRFHFPSGETAVRFEPSVIYKHTPLLQSLETTTVWGVSGPHEVWFWRTKGGEQYLIEQIRKLKTKGPLFQPIRVSLCPFDTETAVRTRRAFLAEMQVQHECGVDVRMIDQKSLEAVIGNMDLAIAVFGDALGIMLHGIHGPVDEAYILLALDQTRLVELKEKFSELYNESVGWELYKRTKGIEFSNRAIQSIVSRRDRILNSAQFPSN
jgi:hypothetical protein